MEPLFAIYLRKTKRPGRIKKVKMNFIIFAISGIDQKDDKGTFLPYFFRGYENWYFFSIFDRKKYPF